WMAKAIWGVTGRVLIHAVTEGLPPAWGRLVWRLRAAVPRLVRGLIPKRPPVERVRGPVTRVRGPRASTYLIDRYLTSQYVTFLGIGIGVASVLILLVDL